MHTRCSDNGVNSLSARKFKSNISVLVSGERTGVEGLYKENRADACTSNSVSASAELRSRDTVRSINSEWLVLVV